MAKNIIVCCDGTCNEFGNTNTNVVRLFQCLDRSSGSEQITYYDPGVGTLSSPTLHTQISRKISVGLGMAFGAGIIPNVEEALSFISDYYKQGDKLYIFGFSRGAFTARIIAGLLHKCGLRDSQLINLTRYVTQIYRYGRDAQINADFRITFGRECPIHFLGVWDTVSTVGWIYNPEHFPFTRENPSVCTIRHAVALDERRCFYRTNLWGEEVEGQHPNKKEIWFSGVHSDIGGGYPVRDSSIWKITFKWMVDEARASGLIFNEAKVEDFLQQNTEETWHQSLIHNSLKGLWNVCEYLPKKYWDSKTTPPAYRYQIPRGNPRHVPHGAQLHSSIFKRIRDVNGYSPVNLDANFVQSVIRSGITQPVITYSPQFS